MSKSKKLIRIIGIIFSIAILVFFDQYTKIVMKSKKDREVFKPIIKKIFGFEYLENDGVAFGMASGKIGLIVGIVVIISAVLVYFIYLLERTINKYPEVKVKFSIIEGCFIFMIAGAVGNLIDRIRFKYVVDFIKVTFIDFPIFNVADCYVTVSAVVLFIVILFTKEDELNLIKIRK